MRAELTNRSTMSIKRPRDGSTRIVDAMPDQPAAFKPSKHAKGRHPKPKRKKG